MTDVGHIEVPAESILYEDADVVAVDKAPGWLSDATRDPRRDHLGAALARRAGDDAVTFYPVHRLDRPTSGVVLFARTRPAATALMRQFQDRTITKMYQAVVGRPSGEPWQIGTTFHRRSYLRHHKGRTEEVRAGGKVAETSFEVRDLADTVALIEAAPLTGRTHQLRVHLAAVGAPIIGDVLYGSDGAGDVRPGDVLPGEVACGEVTSGKSAGRDGSRMWLHAAGLDVVHPNTGRPLHLRSRRALVLAGGGPGEVVASG